jgi:hypothetical protein
LFLPFLLFLLFLLFLPFLCEELEEELELEELEEELELGLGGAGGASSKAAISAGLGSKAAIFRLSTVERVWTLAMDFPLETIFTRYVVPRTRLSRMSSSRDNVSILVLLNPR